MDDVIGPTEVLIFVLIAFVLPFVIIFMDDRAWERSKREGDPQTRGAH
jgi:hypothetical protein